MNALVVALGIMSFLFNFSAEAGSGKNRKAKSAEECESLSMDECRDTPGCTPSGGRGEKSCLVDSDEVETVVPAVVCDMFSVRAVNKGDKSYCDQIDFDDCVKMTRDKEERSKKAEVMTALRLCKVDK